MKNKGGKIAVIIFLVFLFISFIVVGLFMETLKSIEVKLDNTKWKPIQDDSDYSETWFKNKIIIKNVNPILLQFVKKNIYGDVFFCDEAIGEVTLVSKSERKSLGIYNINKTIQEITIEENGTVEQDIFLKLYNSKIPIVWKKYIDEGETGKIEGNITLTFKIGNISFDFNQKLKINESQSWINYSILEEIDGLKKNCSKNEYISKRIYYSKPEGQSKLFFNWSGSLCKKPILIINFEENMSWSGINDTNTVIEQDMEINSYPILLRNFPQYYLIFLDEIHVGKCHLRESIKIEEKERFITFIRPVWKKYSCEIVLNNCQLDDYFSRVVQLINNTSNEYNVTITLVPLLSTQNHSLMPKIIKSLLEFFTKILIRPFSQSIELASINPDYLYNSQIEPILEGIHFFIPKPDKPIKYTPPLIENIRYAIIIIGVVTIISYISYYILGEKKLR